MCGEVVKDYVAWLTHHRLVKNTSQVEKDQTFWQPTAAFISENDAWRGVTQETLTLIIEHLYTHTHTSVNEVPLRAQTPECAWLVTCGIAAHVSQTCTFQQ